MNLADPLSCLHKNQDDILSFILNPNLAKIAINNVNKLALTNTDWAELFSKDVINTQETKLMNDVVNNPEFIRVTNMLQNALRCSLMEESCKIAWAKKYCALSCYVALHTNNSQEWISNSIGDIVKADTRRLEDVRFEIEEESTNYMLLINAIIALSRCVCKK